MAKHQPSGKKSAAEKSKKTAMPRTIVPVTAPPDQVGVLAAPPTGTVSIKPITIVATTTPEEHAGVLAPALLLPPTHLTYHNGHLLTSAQVITIFWGAAWAQPAQSGFIPQVNGFFDFILSSSLIDLLGEYSVAGQTIGHGNRIGSVTIAATEPGGGTGIVSDAQIQTALQGWLAANTVPAATNNTLYFVFLPPGVTSTAFSLQSCAAPGFCGYHSDIGGTNIFYAVEPFLPCNGCTFGDGGTLDSLTKVCSHELCEAITDPNSGGWWDDFLASQKLPSEIGDICNSTQAKLGGYTVQLEWSNQANKCRLKPATLPTVTWTPATPIVYGTQLAAAQLNATADEPGNFVYTPPLSACLPAGSHTLSVVFTPADGTHQTVTATATINVLKATPTINWANPSNIVYGTPLDSGQLNASATWSVCGSNSAVPGTFTYNFPIASCLPAGTVALTADFAPSDTADYNIASATVLLNILKATPTINWANPADIDHGTALDNTQLNATATWVVCGTIQTVAGTFMYNPPASTLLPIGLNQPLNVAFLPNDTANYNAASDTVHINVLTGYPIVLSVTFAPTTLPKEDRTQMTVVVKNDSIHSHKTQEPNPGFEYSEGDTFLTGAAPGRKSFPGIAGAYRIGVDLLASPYKQGKLYRWGFEHDLAPGETVTVNGFIRFHNSRENGQYYVAMIEEVNNVLIDHFGTTGITVLHS